MLAWRAYGHANTRSTASRQAGGASRANGPVAAVRIGRIDGEFIVNPSYPQLEESDLDLRVAGTKEALLMVECGADEVDEEAVASALEFAP